MIFCLCLVVALGDVREVENTAMQTDTPSLVFEQDLVIDGSGEKGDNFLWEAHQPSITAAPNGHIFVGDDGANTIWEYDSEGQFVKRHGRRGEGPGEYRLLLNFHIFKDGTALGMDVFQERISFNHYKQGPTFDRFERPERNFRRSYPSNDGAYLYVEEIKPVRPKLDISFGIIKRSGENVATLGKAELEMWNGAQEAHIPAKMSARLAKIFDLEEGPRVIVAFDDRGYAYTASTDKYEIQRLNLKTGDVDLKIRKQYKPRIRTKADIDELITDTTARYKAEFGSMSDVVNETIVRNAFEQSNLGEVYHPLFGLLATPDGFVIAVQPTYDGLRAKGDIFNPEGAWVGTLDLDGYQGLNFDRRPRMTFRNGFAYTLQTNDEGEHRAIRYKISRK